MLVQSDPDAARRLLDQAQDDVHERWRFYEHLAGLPPAGAASPPAPEGKHD
jgi:hypothetical protein